MMATEQSSYRWLLYAGGELFVNKAGQGWSVDVFAFDSDPSDDPIYHAFYLDRSDALHDALSWRAWEGERGAKERKYGR